MSLRAWWEVKGLRDLQPFLEVTPTALVYSEEGSSFVLAVICNDDAHKECEPNHAAQKYKDVNVEGVNLKSRGMRRKS
jgi:hypothetical protein